MTSLDSYLQQHFLSKAEFAIHHDTTVDALDALIAAHAFPQASYVVTGDGYIVSAVFGRLPGSGALAGEYFRPEYDRWFELGRGEAPDEAARRVREVLNAELKAALISLHGDTYRLADAFDDRGVERPGLARRLRSYLRYFLNGTFGLCVADPSRGESIARKEVLQEKLAALTADGTRTDPPGVSAVELRTLIDAYAAVSMPFSPVEYALSSRKRLVDDLRGLLRDERADRRTEA